MMALSGRGEKSWWEYSVTYDVPVKSGEELEKGNIARLFVSTSTTVRKWGLS